MAHLWASTHELSDNEPTIAWRPDMLHGDAFSLASGTLVALAQEDASARTNVLPLLLRTAAASADTWALLGADEVRVNGMPLLGGIAVLRDRDELQVRSVGGRRAQFFFSTERLATIERSPGSEHPIRCPRCKTVIERDAPAVRCVGCNVWHHQGPAKPCWTYAPTCALCDASTSLEAGYRWTPALL